MAFVDNRYLRTVWNRDVIVERSCVLTQLSRTSPAADRAAGVGKTTPLLLTTASADQRLFYLLKIDRRIHSVCEIVTGAVTGYVRCADSWLGICWKQSEVRFVQDKVDTTLELLRKEIVDAITNW